MFGAVEVIPLNKIIILEDVPIHPQSSSRLRTGKVIKVSYRLNKDSSTVTYDIDGGFRKYVNVEDCSSFTFINRKILYYDTRFDLGDVVQVEITGLMRRAEVDSIEICWVEDHSFVNYGVRDRSETIYYGVSEKSLTNWNQS
jgi:hypothetical protein